VVGAGGARSYTSKHGYSVTVDVQADAVTAVELARRGDRAGRVPAEDDASAWRANGEAGPGAAQEGKVVAAICHAGWLLAKAA
jgi:putative intracellular protease/amidase